MKCYKCNIEIHPLRIKALPNTKVCVDCSTAGAYRAVTTTHGTGDHTWNDIKVMTPEQFSQYQDTNSSDEEDTHTITFGIENTKK
tara:strand:- start:2896 stop:3150 length:255 start_codon:yes stop_codon:yes gene_type:complete